MRKLLAFTVNTPNAITVYIATIIDPTLTMLVAISLTTHSHDPSPLDVFEPNVDPRAHLASFSL